MDILVHENVQIDKRAGLQISAALSKRLKNIRINIAVERLKHENNIVEKTGSENIVEIWEKWC